MGRLAATVIASVAVAVLAVPAVVDGATPKAGSYWNHSQSRGLYMETTRHNVNTLWLFCRDHRYDGPTFTPERRAGRYETRHPIHIGRGGKFSYKGTGTRYGPHGEPLGHWHMSLQGRFTSRTHVKIRRTLKGCGPTYTVSAHRTGH
jgi:hypothetical protein